MGIELERLEDSMRTSSVFLGKTRPKTAHVYACLEGSPID